MLLRCAIVEDIVPEAQKLAQALHTAAAGRCQISAKLFPVRQRDKKRLFTAFTVAQLSRKAINGPSAFLMPKSKKKVLFKPPRVYSQLYDLLICSRIFITFIGFSKMNAQQPKLGKGGTNYMTMYANSEDFQVLAITTMVSSFVAEWNDRNMKLQHEWRVMPLRLLSMRSAQSSGTARRTAFEIQTQ